jgi:tetratricopeptide (TPR) repeat protein
VNRRRNRQHESYLHLLVVGALTYASFPLAAQEKSSFSDLVMGGYAHEEQKNFSAAVDNYSRALALKEESVIVLIRRAYSFVQLGEFEKAGKDLKEVSFLMPVSMSDYTSLAWLKATCPFEIIRDGPLAVAYASKAMKERKSAETYDILAAAYAEMNDFQRARNTVLEGIKRFPDSPRVPAMRERLALYNQKKPYRESWVDEEAQVDRTIRKSF